MMWSTRKFIKYITIFFILSILNLLFTNCGPSFQSQSIEEKFILSEIISTQEDSDSSPTERGSSEQQILEPEESTRKDTIQAPPIEIESTELNPIVSQPVKDEPSKDTTSKEPVKDAPKESEPFPSNTFLKIESTLKGTDPNKNLMKPNYLQTINGAVNGTKITRITKNESDGFHSYSKRQTWNADESLLMVGSKVTNASTYNMIYRPPLTVENVWSTTNPDILYGMSSSNRSKLVQHNVKTRKNTDIVTLSGYDICTIGAYEGSQSDNNRYIVLSCEKSSGTIDLISIDIMNKKILGQTRAESDYNWASVSRSGKYIIVENNKPGSNEKDRKLFRYDINFKSKQLILTGIRLKDGKEFKIDITNRAGNGHLSCRAIRRSNWCYFSSRDQGQRMGAFQVGNGIKKVELWGFSKSSYSAYKNQAKMSVSPSGRKLIFSSDWVSNSNNSKETNEYILELDD